MLRGRSVFKFIIAELHLWLGLVSGLIVFILYLTETIYAFKPQIEDFINRDAVYIETTAGRLSALGSDLNSGVDFSPTQQQGAVKRVLSDRLKAVEHQFEELLENDVEKFNEQLEKSRHKIDLEKKS